KLHSVQRIIVQPNIEAQFVRKILVQQGFYIAHEEMVEEKNHIYEIIVADKKQAGMPHTEYTEKELLFGPRSEERRVGKERKCRVWRIRSTRDEKNRQLNR